MQASKVTKMIKKLHQTVQCRLLENIVRCDPFVLLPVELLREITSYLDFRQKIRCLSVCKRWQAVLISDKRFYGRLNLLAPDLKRIKASSIESYVKKAQGRLEWLMTERMLAPAVLKHHLKFANELAVLHIPCQRVLLSELPRARNLRRLTLTGTEKGQLPSIDEILNIGRAFALLTHLKARTVRVPGYSMPILKLINTELSCLKSLEISLDSWIQTDELFMYDGKATMQNLQELKLYDGDQRYTAGLLLGPTLELPNTLKILSAKILPDPSNEALQLPDRLVGLDLTVDGQMPLGLKIPAVRRLLLRRYIGGITMDDWARLFSHLCELQLTEAQECGQFALILGTCQNLETLVLHPRFAVTGSYESELGTLAIRNPQLRHLNLSLFLELRGATLARLVHGLVHLKELVIDGCGQIDRDVLTWVRSRGVLVRQSLAD